MTLELWIILVLAVAACALGAFVRLRKKRQRTAPRSDDNVYPLW
ncbi:MAG TPA: hypothetical protein VHY35_23825 [Stellaceae bacterium]|nr:hypothetical protein [Stellaceae bacterium]